MLAVVRLVYPLSVATSAALIVKLPLNLSTPPLVAPAAAVWSANFLIAVRAAASTVCVPTSIVIASFLEVLRTVSAAFESK